MTALSAQRSVSPKVRRILDRAMQHQEISCEDGEILFSAQGLDLAALLATADHVRRERVGDKVTFVTVRNIRHAEMPPTIIELLTNLGQLPEEVELICLPLRISEGDGSPVRAVALVEEG